MTGQESSRRRRPSMRTVLEVLLPVVAFTLGFGLATGRFLVALTTGKTPDPVDVRLNDAEALADLLLADFHPGSLTVDVRAERDSVDLVAQDRPEQLTFVRTRHGGEVGAEKAWESRHLVTRPSERHGGARTGTHGEILTA